MALLLVLAYLALSINVYLETAVFGVFRLGYGRIGPTEARLILILLNTLLLVTGAAGGLALEAIWLANGVCLLLAAGMGLTLLGRFAANLRQLARLEPLPRR